MSFVQRLINVTFRLGSGTFENTKFNTVTLSNLRVSTLINSVSGPDFNSASIRIFGMTLPQMNQLSEITDQAFLVKHNIISVAAGDAVNGMSTVFVGNIQNAWFDGNSSPQVVFNVSAASAFFHSIQPANPTSYRGAVNVADAMKALAKQMGYGFSNNGVNVTLKKPYLPGTLRDQVRNLAEQANIYFTIDRDVLYIYSKRTGSSENPILVSVETGMVGYPTYMSNGLAVRTLWNPNIRVGSPIQVKSILKVAKGVVWRVQSFAHSLDSMVPGGQWFTTMQCTTLNPNQSTQTP